MAGRHPFKPTECSCRDCRACCEHMPGNLVPGDFYYTVFCLGGESPKGLAGYAPTLWT